MSSFCNVLAIDDHAGVIGNRPKQLGAERVRSGSCTNLPLPDQSADFVTALDVLEHIGDDSIAVAEIARILKGNGVAVITVPALSQLWSDWDVALQHFRRYNRKSLKATLSHPQLRLTHLNYINVFALPAIWLARTIQKVRQSALRLEDQIPPAPFEMFSCARSCASRPARRGCGFPPASAFWRWCKKSEPSVLNSSRYVPQLVQC